MSTRRRRASPTRTAPARTALAAVPTSPAPGTARSDASATAAARAASVPASRSFLPRLPFPAQRPDERIDRDSLGSVKKALTRRGLDTTSIGLRGPARLAHLNKRLQLSLDREEEARSETRLVRALRAYGISFVTPGVVGDERNRELARRLHERRERDRIRGLAQAKITAWKRITGDTTTERLLSFKDYNKAKFTALVSKALANCNYPEIERLCKLGADPDHATKGGHTALCQAATFDRAAFARVMVEEHGADPNKEDKAGNSPLTLSCAFGHMRTARALVKAGADVNRTALNGRTPLMSAARAGHEGTVQALLQIGAEVNGRASKNGGQTALLAAVQAGRLEMVAFLVTGCNADIFQKDDDGYDAYHRSKADRQFQIQAWLRREILSRDPLAFTKAGSYQEEDLSRLGKRARAWAEAATSAGGSSNNPSAGQSGGSVSLPPSPDKASRTLSGSPVRSPSPRQSSPDGTPRQRRLGVPSTSARGGLLSGRPMVSAKTATRGERALALAIASNDFESVLEIVRARRAPVDMESYKSTRRETALMRAAHYGRLEEIELLLAMGADVNHHNSPFGRTALMAAARNDQSEAIVALLAWGAYINAEDSEGWTAVMVAGREGNTAAVRTLVQHGAAVRHQTPLGATAFIVAAANSKTETASELMAQDESMLRIERSVTGVVQHKMKTDRAKGKGGGHEHDDLRKLIEARPQPRPHLEVPDAPPTVADTDRRHDDMALATGIGLSLNETMLEDLERLFKEETLRSRAKKKGRRGAVSVDVPNDEREYVASVLGMTAESDAGALLRAGPGKHVIAHGLGHITDVRRGVTVRNPGGEEVRLRDPSFAFSLQEIDLVVEELRRELAGAQRKARQLCAKVEAAKAEAERQRVLNRRGDEPDALTRDGYPEDEPACFKEPAEMKLAAFYTTTKQFDKAQRVLENLLSLQRSRYGKDSIVLAQTHTAFGCLFAKAAELAGKKMKKADKEREDRERRKSIQQGVVPEQQRRRRQQQQSVATELRPTKATNAALVRFRHARKLLAARHGPLHPWIVANDRHIVELLMKVGRYQEAEGECDAIEEARRKKVLRQHPLAVDASDMRAKVQARAGDLRAKADRKQRKRDTEERAAALAVQKARAQENVHPECYVVEGAEWFRNALHGKVGQQQDADAEDYNPCADYDRGFPQAFESFCTKSQALPTLRLYWKFDAFTSLQPKTEEFHQALQTLVRQEIRATRHAFLTKGMRDMIFRRVEKINAPGTTFDPRKLFDEARVQAFLMLHQQFKQFLRHVRGQRWLRQRVADRDGQTARGVVPFQALARRMIALGRLPERRRLDALDEEYGGVSAGLQDKYEAVMRKHFACVAGATMMQELARGVAARRRFCAVVAGTYREVKQAGHAFFVDTRTGTYVADQPKAVRRCRRRWGDGWRDLGA